MKPYLILLALAALFLTAYAPGAEASELSVSQDTKTVLKVRISPRSLAYLAEHPAQLYAILRDGGIDCCSSQIRVSDSVWRCCHGKFVITASDPELQGVMVAAFNGPSIR
jgi:hypothetical protein